MGTHEHIKKGGSSLTQHLKVLFSREIPQNTHINKKRVVYHMSKVLPCKIELKFIFMEKFDKNMTFDMQK
jgi:hypothetical protein